MQLGQALKLYRSKRKLLQKQIAANRGITREYYNKIEMGRAAPLGATLRRILKSTGISARFSLK